MAPALLSRWEIDKRGQEKLQYSKCALKNQSSINEGQQYSCIHEKSCKINSCFWKMGKKLYYVWCKRTEVTREIWKKQAWSCLCMMTIVYCLEGFITFFYFSLYDKINRKSTKKIYSGRYFFLQVLTLASNERIPLNPSMRLIFEISHLKTATPATVSRAGILYLNASDIGWAPMVQSWIDSREIQSERANLTILFDKVITFPSATNHGRLAKVLGKLRNMLQALQDAW